MSFLDIKNQLKKKSSSNQKKINKSFFKTQKGEYSENDYFIGLTMGQIREIAKKYDKVYFSTIKKLLNSKIHEESWRERGRVRGFREEKRVEEKKTRQKKK